MSEPPTTVISQPLSAVTPHEMEPAELTTSNPPTTNTPDNNAGLTVDFVDASHVTLIAVGGLHESGAVAHRLTTLITAGVRHISIDLRHVREVAPPTIACLTDIAFHLSDTGGTLELVNVQPVVAAAIAASSNGDNSQEAQPWTPSSATR